jgi:DNA topoisomerase-1
VAKLEELEIGRPSTYASILRTITSRDYVFKKGSALVPTWLAFAVTRLLEEHFGHLVDYAFTADMEQTLDEIANGAAERKVVLSDFYFGSGGEGADEGLRDAVSELGDIDARALSSFPVPGDPDITIRVGRYGTYIETTDGRRANVGEDLPPDELTAEYAHQLLDAPVTVERELGVTPDTNLPVVAKDGRYGPYVTEVLPEDAPKNAKARTGSLFKSMSIDTVTLEDAMRLLSLPRLVGEADGEPITAQNGRYGPYLKKGTDSRSLTTEDQIFDVTLEEALAIYAQPKLRGRAAAAAPLKELGNDPATGTPMVVKSGRFGPYVTDGTTNATLRKDDDVEELTAERAAELLADKRAKGPAPKKTPVRRAAPAKKATATKTTTVKKPTAAKKTTTAKKPPALTARTVSARAKKS